MQGEVLTTEMVILYLDRSFGFVLIGAIGVYSQQDLYR
jgi:hypothetical protein